MLDNFYSILRIQDEIYFLLMISGSWFLIRHAASSRKLLPLGLLCMFLFGCLWRIVFPTALVSRYSEVLIYPTVLICGYTMAYWYHGSFSVFKHRFSGKWIFLILLICMTVYSVVKILRIRPKTLKRGAETVKQDCGPASGFILCTKESVRLGYYSGLHTRQLPEQILSGPPEHVIDKLKREIRFSHYRADRIYMMAVLPKSRPELIALLKADPDLRLLADMDLQKGSSQRMVILAERPRPKRDLRSSPIHNGDFSVPLQAVNNRKLKEGLIRRGIAFFKDENVILPDNWYIYSTDPHAQACLKKDHDGNVMKIHTEGAVSLMYNGKLTFSPHLKGIGFFMAGTDGTEAVFKVWKITGKNTQDKHLPIAEIRVVPEKRFYMIYFDDRDFNPGDVFSFEMVFRSGDAEVDDFLLLYDDDNR